MNRVGMTGICTRGKKKKNRKKKKKKKRNGRRKQTGDKKGGEVVFGEGKIMCCGKWAKSFQIVQTGWGRVKGGSKKTA